MGRSIGVRRGWGLMRSDTRSSQMMNTSSTNARLVLPKTVPLG